MYLESEAQTYLQKLGLTQEEADLYLSLVRNGPSNLLKASRYSGVERTKLYRMIGSLKDRGIIEEVLAHKKHVLKAASADRLLSIIQSQQSELTTAQSVFPNFKHYLQSIQAPTQGTEVLYYEGIDGIRQILWNTLQARPMLRCYVDTVFNRIVGQKFLESWGEEVVALNMEIRQFNSPNFLKSHKGVQPVNLGKKFSMKDAPKEVAVTHGMDIYNDTVAIYYWENNEILGVEIKNPAIARMQESIFDFFWNKIKS
ncbi:MAG: helix-turn-helix domain-containing protein [Patescibacteria group bacterium]|jgi:sugar-specific transcriptional regulator TrmB